MLFPRLAPVDNKAPGRDVETRERWVAAALECYTRVMKRGWFPGAALTFVAALAAAGCAKKPANKTEAGQVAAAPAVPPTTEEGCRACNGVFGPHGIDPA